MTNIECFVCIISLDMMGDPVTTPAGHSYERAAIEQWIDKQGIDPLTRQPLVKADLRPNIALRGAINEWKNLDDQWQQRVEHLKEQLRAAAAAAAESAAPAPAASSSSSGATERHLLQVISYMQSRPMYAAAKARVGVTAELDIPPLLRQALAVHTMSPMFTENVEKIISAMIAGMNDDGETMRAILEGLVHMASTAGTQQERSWLHTQLGTAFHKKGKTEPDVQKQKESAVAINPNNAEAKRHWGWEIDRLALHEKDASKKAQMHRDSLDLLEAALKIDPFSADTWDNKGRALRALNRDGDALVAFKRCTEICPNHLQAWGALGELHAKAARWPEAERCFRKAISISPKNAISVWKLGKMFQQQAAFGPKGPEQQRLFRLAANTHTEAINLDANNAKFFADCGYCLSRNGDVVQARRMIERGLNIDPDHKDCKKNLTYLNNNKK